jgi:hypothetical protein
MKKSEKIRNGSEHFKRIQDSKFKRNPLTTKGHKGEEGVRSEE